MVVLYTQMRTVVVVPVAGNLYVLLLQPLWPCLTVLQHKAGPEHARVPACGSRVAQGAGGGGIS
jgi:hypothetical protein